MEAKIVIPLLRGKEANEDQRTNNLNSLKYENPNVCIKASQDQGIDICLFHP